MAVFRIDKTRDYQTDNFYAAVERQIQVEKEVRKIVRKAERTVPAKEAGGGPGKAGAKTDRR